MCVVSIFLAFLLSSLYNAYRCKKDITSEKHVAIIKQIQVRSPFWGDNSFSNKIAVTMVISWLVIWQVAVLDTFLVAEKYPFTALLADINGRAILIT